MHLNGWQRLAIVASVAWAIGGGLWAHNMSPGRTARWAPYDRMCAYRADAPRLTPAEYENCSHLGAKLGAEDSRERLFADVLIVAIPIIGGWLLLWLVGWAQTGILKSN